MKSLYPMDKVYIAAYILCAYLVWNKNYPYLASFLLLIMAYDHYNNSLDNGMGDSA